VYWNSVKDAQEPALFESYLKRYPQGQFAQIARIRIDGLRRTAPQTFGSQATAPEVRGNPVDGQRYVWIKPGSFRMGCSEGDRECRQDEMPPHQVTISKGFWLGETEVTVLAYEKFSRDTGTRTQREKEDEVLLGFSSRDSATSNKQQPMARLTWAEAVSFCKWAGGRLPAEAEWEFAARGGTTGARYGSLQDIAVAADAMTDGTVALKLPNAFGLYDMLGNVAEWTADWYAADYYGQSPGIDPKGPDAGVKLVIRGGSTWDRPSMLRVSARDQAAPSYAHPSVGMRCVWMPSAQGSAFAVPVESVVGLLDGALNTPLGDGSALQLPNAQQSPSSRAVANADPKKLLRIAKTAIIHSRTSFFTPEALEREFVKQAGYNALGLILVKDARVADLAITIDRPLFTYTFTYAVTDAKTSVVLDAGKVTAIDGNTAAGKIAKELMTRLTAMRRGDKAENPK